MGRSAKIRHRRRRKSQLRAARIALLQQIIAEKVAAPLRERRRLPLGVAVVESPSADLDDALASALAGLEPSRG